MSQHPATCRCFDCLTSEAKTKCRAQSWCLRGNGHVGTCAGAVDMIRSYIRTTLQDVRRIRAERRKATLVKGDAKDGGNGE